MGDELYLEPNRRARIIVLLVIILVVLLGASLNPIINYLTPSQSATLAELDTGAKLLGLLSLIANAVAFALSLFWVIYFARLGYRTFKFGSHPPPGTIVIFRTRVRTGKQAVLSAWLCISFAVLMLLPATLIGYVLWQITSDL